LSERARIAAAAKAAHENKRLIAALEALRHPKPEFFRDFWNS